MSKCRDCEREYKSEWQKANREKVRGYKKQWEDEHREQHLASKRAEYERNKERASAYMKDWRERNPDKVAAYNRNPQKREGRLLRAHGISLAQFHEMWERQAGKCPICLRELPSEFLPKAEWKNHPVRPHVDHCHTTGRVRGILCSTCNQGIGLLREDPAVFQRAAEYLA